MREGLRMVPLIGAPIAHAGCAGCLSLGLPLRTQAARGASPWGSHCIHRLRVVPLIVAPIAHTGCAWCLSLWPPLHTQPVRASLGWCTGEGARRVHRSTAPLLCTPPVALLSPALPTMCAHCY